LTHLKGSKKQGRLSVINTIYFTNYVTSLPILSYSICLLPNKSRDPGRMNGFKSFITDVHLQTFTNIFTNIAEPRERGTETGVDIFGIEIELKKKSKIN
jgi:hypothetical protein